MLKVNDKISRSEKEIKTFPESNFSSRNNYLLRRLLWMLLAVIPAIGGAEVQPFAVWSAEDFELKCKNGATGTLETTPDGRLKITKSSDTGFLVVRARTPYRAKPGDELQLRADAVAVSAIPEYSLGMLRLLPSGSDDFQSHNIGGRRGGMQQTVLLYVPTRKLVTRRVVAGAVEFQPAVLISGPPSISIWNNFAITDYKKEKQQWAGRFSQWKLPDHTSQMISEAELNQKLVCSIDHTGQVVRRNGRSILLIDGQPAPPLIFKGGKFTSDGCYFDGKLFSASGIDLVSVGFRLGDNPGHPGVWRGADDLDLQAAMKPIRDALRLNPEAKIILAIMFTPYYAFHKEHPEELWIAENGCPVYGSSSVNMSESTRRPIPKGSWPWVSYYSEKLNAAYAVQLDCIIDELKRSGLSKAIVGLHFGGGSDNQMAIHRLDCGEPAKQAFHRYLRKEYCHDPAALKKAWRQPMVEFDTAEIPSFASIEFDFNPEHDQDKIDFYRFMKLEPWRVIGRLAERARNRLAKPVFTIRWCIRPFDGTLRASLDIDDFLHSDVFDILVAQASYERRVPGISCGYGMPLASFHLNGKLYIHELDLRTYAAPSYGDEISNIGWGHSYNIDMWEATHRKLAGSMLAAGMGFWYLDMAPGWFRTPEIQRDIAEVASRGRDMVGRIGSDWHPDAAFVIDAEGMFLYNAPRQRYNFDLEMLISDQIKLLYGSSTPFDIYTLSDLMVDPELAKRYKVLVFGALHLVDAPRKQFLDELKRGQRTLVFLSGTGRVGGAEHCGNLKLIHFPASMNHEVLPVPGEKLDMAAFSMCRRYASNPNVQTRWYNKTVFIAPEEQKDDLVRARFSKNGLPAVLERQFRDWQAVYIADAAGLTPEYFNRIVREAGAYRLTDSGFQCDTNGNFMSVHCMRSGKAVFAMPYKADVVNLFNGKRYKGVTEIPLKVEAGSTYWFSMTPAE